MAKVTFGNHAALRVQRAERQRIRKFYREVLGCRLNREFEEKDYFRIGDDYYISFLYGGTGGKEPDKGAVYAQARCSRYRTLTCTFRLWEDKGSGCSV